MFRRERPKNNNNNKKKKTRWRLEPQNFSVVIQPRPRFANLLGGKLIAVFGPCFDATQDIKCKFGETEVQGRFIDETKAECLAPFVGGPGTFLLAVSLNGGQDYPPEGTFYYGKLHVSSTLCAFCSRGCCFLLPENVCLPLHASKFAYFFFTQSHLTAFAFCSDV